MVDSVSLINKFRLFNKLKYLENMTVSVSREEMQRGRYANGNADVAIWHVPSGAKF